MNILLTSGARRIDFIGFFQQALKQSDTLGNIIVADPDENAPSLQVADRPYVIPHQTDESYIDAIFKICEENDINAIIPLNDWEVPKLAYHETDFEKMGVKLFVPPTEVVKKARDKARYEETLGEFGVKAPHSYLSVEETKKALDNGEVNFPLIVKPRNGSASVGIEIVNSLEELESAYQFSIQKIKDSPIAKDAEYDVDHNIMVEEVIEGEKYSLDIVNDLDGNFLTAFARKQLAMRGGDVDRTITSHKDELLNLGRKIGINLKHRGYLNTDVFFDGEHYYVIDMNPRFGGGYAFSHHAGANIPAAFIALAGDKEVKRDWLNSDEDIELARYDIVQRIDKSHLNHVNEINKQSSEK